jgi:predicted metal-binding protein
MSEHDQTDSSLSSDVTIHVCVTCRHGKDGGDEADRPGARLHRALREALARNHPSMPLRVEAVRCLSVCKRPCTVAVSSPGRWTYVYGDFDSETAAETILAGVGLYAQSSDGIVPWRERPEAFRKGMIARIPPMPPILREAAE